MDNSTKITILYVLLGLLAARLVVTVLQLKQSYKLSKGDCKCQKRKQQ